MTVQLAFRNIEATDALKEHIQKRVAKFSKIITYPMDVHVTLSVEKTVHCAEITVHAEHREIVAEAKTESLYESIDSAVGKIETQLRKEREKKKGHQAAHLISRPAGDNLAADVDADLPHRGKKLRNSTAR